MSPDNGGQIHRVAVFKDQREVKFRISPARVMASRNDSIVFHNMTDYAMNVVFHQESPFKSSSSSIASSAFTDPPVPLKDLPSGVHLYDAMVIVGSEQMAAQGSRPIIIIYD